MLQKKGAYLHCLPKDLPYHSLFLSILAQVEYRETCLAHLILDHWLSQLLVKNKYSINTNWLTYPNYLPPVSSRN